MVRLSRIYTRTGDDGSTALGDGSRRRKDDARVAAYGTVDELNSVLGLIITESGVDPELQMRLRRTQNELFDVGSDLCVPGEAGKGLRLGEEYVQRLEAWIDEANEGLQPLNSFVLPGGHRLAAWLHLGRTVCRRAERYVVELLTSPDDQDEANPIVAQYLNRLSDLLFVLARRANDDGRSDVLWEPGATRDKPEEGEPDGDKPGDAKPG